MFNFTKEAELQKQIDDLKRENLYIQRERASDQERISSSENLRTSQLRFDRAQEKWEAQAKATEAQYAKEYAEKAVSMAAKCSADFGAAVATLTEKFLECVKEFKPVEKSISVIPTTTEVNNH